MSLGKKSADDVDDADVTPRDPALPLALLPFIAEAVPLLLVFERFVVVALLVPAVEAAALRLPVYMVLTFRFLQ